MDYKKSLLVAIGNMTESECQKVNKIILASDKIINNNIKETCCIEIFVTKYFGLREPHEYTIINTDFGDIVNIISMYEDNINSFCPVCELKEHFNYPEPCKYCDKYSKLKIVKIKSFEK